MSELPPYAVGFVGTALGWLLGIFTAILTSVLNARVQAKRALELQKEELLALGGELTALDIRLANEEGLNWLSRVKRVAEEGRTASDLAYWVGFYRQAKLTRTTQVNELILQERKLAELNDSVQRIIDSAPADLKAKMQELYANALNDEK